MKLAFAICLACVVSVLGNGSVMVIVCEDGVTAAEAPVPADAFCMWWAIPNTNAIIVPWGNTGSYDGAVNFGDGTGWQVFSTWNDAAWTHSYAGGADNYRIAVTGKVGRILFNNGAYKTYLLSVDQWGDVGMASLNGSFRGTSSCTNYPDIPASMGNITEGSYGWYGNSALKHFMDVSPLTGMVVCTWMFGVCNSVTNTLNLTTWTAPQGMAAFLYDADEMPELPDISAANDITSLSSAFKLCALATNGIISYIPTNCTTAADIYDNTPLLVGDISTISNAPACVIFRTDASGSLTYGNTNGMLSANTTQNGYSFTLGGCSLNSNDCAYILIDLDDSGTTNGTVAIAGNNDPIAPIGYAAWTNLVDVKTMLITN